MDPPYNYEQYHTLRELIIEKKVSVKPNKIEILNPYINLDKTSLAWSSVPSQFFVLGGEGAGLSISRMIVLYLYGIMGMIIHPEELIKFFTNGSL